MSVLFKPGARGRIALVAAVLAGVPSAARADVVDRSPGGFTVRTIVTIARPADRVYTALTAEIGRWWDSAHTFSGDASNLSLDAKPGGCFCERRTGGGVQHGVVVNAVHGELLRVSAALGPLQSAGVAGTLTWQLAASSPGSVTATVTYVVGGYYPGGLDKIADPVDGVIGDSLRRLKAFVER